MPDAFDPQGALGPALETLGRGLNRAHERIDKVEDRIIALELTTVRREGPFVERVNDGLRKLDRIETSTLATRRAAEHTFNRGDRIAAGLLATLLVVLQAYSAFVH